MNGRLVAVSDEKAVNANQHSTGFLPRSAEPTSVTTVHYRGGLGGRVKKWVPERWPSWPLIIHLSCAYLIHNAPHTNFTANVAEHTR